MKETFRESRPPDFDAYGLVVKDGEWYLVAGRQGSPQVFRLAFLLEVKLLDERFAWPQDFDLQAFWLD